MVRYLCHYKAHYADMSASYAVPPEVGKVGNESPTFIEPVSKRKDGIEAMFAKQDQRKSTSPLKSQFGPEVSPVRKRKRSSSPSPINETVTEHTKKVSRKGRGEDSSTGTRHLEDRSPSPKVEYLYLMFRHAYKYI